MNGKQRVQCVLQSEVPDRVPIDYLANPGIDGRLKAHFGLSGDDDEGLRRMLDVDFRRLEIPYVGPELHHAPPGRTVDMWGIRRRWIEHDSGGYWDYCDFPLADADLDAVVNWPMPSPDDFDYPAVAEQASRWNGYALTIGSPGWGDIINSTGMVRTMEQTLVDLMCDEPAAMAFIDRRIDVQVQVLGRALDAADGRVDLLWLGEDLGTQIGPLISLELFRKHLRPRLQRLVDLGRQRDIPVMMHSCGSSSWAFEDFIEMGVSVVDTLQPEAKDMAPADLKRRYGDRLAFHGCVSTAGPVAEGTPDDVERDVREVLEIMMPGGGYMLSPTHELQDDSPTENVLRMYETARSAGRYGA